MNKLTKELYARAVYTSGYQLDTFAEKFAELIVAECMMLAQSDWVAQSYPSQIDDYAAGINSVRESIKQHFGVAE